VIVLALMAGSDARFEEAGYPFPKNLVEIEGLPLVEHVVRNTTSLAELGARFVFVIRRDEDLRHHTAAVLRLLSPAATVLSVPSLTGGAACTALLAIEHIDNDEPLLITNGDQVLDADLSAIVRGFQAKNLDGGIVVFRSTHPRWSYVRCNPDGFVEEAAEKHPISNLATAGIYYFARGREFVRAAMESIKKDAHVNNAFYVCPCYNELVLAGAKIGVHEIVKDAYHSLATTQGVEAFAEHLAQHRRRP
jgi:dTDP-glucose pyrophosphorylase